MEKYADRLRFVAERIKNWPSGDRRGRFVSGDWRLVWVVFVVMLLAAFSPTYVAAEEAVLSEKEADWAWKTVTLVELEALIARGDVVPTEAEEAETTSFSPLMRATRFSNNPDLLDVLVQRGADINWGDERNGYTALHFAIYEGRIKQVRRLLELGADVNRQAIAGVPIFAALSNGIKDASTRRQLLELLLSYGADLHAEVKSTDKFAVNLLMEAALNQLKWPDRQESYTGILDYLVESGIHPDLAPARNQGGNAMYGVVLMVGGENVIEELVRLGADVNARSATGETPLMFFASSGNSMDVWDALVAYGADIDATNDENRSVLYHARKRMKGEFDNGYEIFGASPFSSIEAWRAFGGEIVARIESLCKEKHYQVCDELEEESDLLRLSNNERSASTNAGKIVGRG